MRRRKYDRYLRVGKRGSEAGSWDMVIVLMAVLAVMAFIPAMGMGTNIGRSWCIVLVAAILVGVWWVWFR